VKGTVTISVSDLNLATVTVKCSGKTVKWINAGKYKTKGNYVITAKDKAGNLTIFKFVIH